ncbi:hypothetical protein TGS27_1658 [Geobacillus stearothermophilus]|uniref:Uncharacterized protein n=1 Tax=Geobacillus stearothermophilus TaxID=1422 RepID=A0A150NB02_GEOSE|nr:hypothetical protein B4114_2828 [Geobacillus stearothermophilus]OAO81279.1 hypothetical protein TGS27_1658 [Geobacillus stearothermophilus]
MAQPLPANPKANDGVVPPCTPTERPQPGKAAMDKKTTISKGRCNRP